ncbi:MAG: hypothetical protein WC962_01210 [Phycisphaerae bacterium]|jgi:hypothetical protein
MMSAHWMMVLLVIIGYITTLTVIIIAVIESHRMDKGKGLLSGKTTPRQFEQQ